MAFISCINTLRSRSSSSSNVFKLVVQIILALGPWFNFNRVSFGTYGAPMQGGYGGMGGNGPAAFSKIGPNNPNTQMVSGTLVDMSNKFIQRITASGTSYISYTEPASKPSFVRRIKDTNRHFILFPDHAYPPGSGHFIVLRKMMMGIKGRQREIVYEAYNMFLTNSARAMILNWPHEGPGAMGQSGGETTNGVEQNKGRPGMQSGNQRMKNSVSDFGQVDAGEVVERTKRKQPVFQPDFKTIHMTLTSSVEDERKAEFVNPQRISSENFDGFSIEQEE